MKNLFYFWFFFFVYVNASEESCKAVVPMSVKNCTDIKISDKKFCCYHSYLKEAHRKIECISFEKNATLIEQQIIAEESKLDYDDVSIDCISKYIKMSLINIIFLSLLFL
jgi:hypothetical protein